MARVVVGGQLPCRILDNVFTRRQHLVIAERYRVCFAVEVVIT